VPVRETAGRRYALAILEIARPNGTLDHWREALDSLEALTSRSAYVEALQTDGMTDEKFQAIVRQVHPDISPVEMNLFRLLRRKARLSLGPSIASYYRELLDLERGVARATVRTAVELTEEQSRALRERLAAQTGRTIELETEVDPSIIGGAVIRIGDQMLDGSTRRRLLNLREQLVRTGT